jgi:hypothetical protein
MRSPINSASGLRRIALRRVAASSRKRQEGSPSPDAYNALSVEQSQAFRKGSAARRLALFFMGSARRQASRNFAGHPPQQSTLQYMSVRIGLIFLAEV